MKTSEMVTGIVSLKEMVVAMAKEGVDTTKKFRDFARANEGRMNGWFQYERQKGMPAIYSLVLAAFHPSENLIPLNYTPLAHNTLYAYPEGWTIPLRLCRGIVFNTQGDLVAMSFPKFFNYREHVESKEMPDEYFEATEKMDGHLGIIFKYNSKYFITTRGSFVSRTSKLATIMLDNYTASSDWDFNFPDNTTLLVEVIHPETRVLTNYGQEKKFVVIGAFDKEFFTDYTYSEIEHLARALMLCVTKVWTGCNLTELIELMKDRSIKNQEGYVVRFENGLRIKLKFETYVGRMFAEKITYPYLMRKYMAGKLAEMMSILDEEIVNVTEHMLADILIAMSIDGSQKDKWRNLYKLISDPGCTPAYKATCRQFVKHLSSAS